MKTHLVSAVALAAALSPLSAAAVELFKNDRLTFEIYGVLLPFVSHNTSSGATVATGTAAAPAAPAGGATMVPAARYLQPDQNPPLDSRVATSGGPSQIGFRASVNLTDKMKGMFDIQNQTQFNGPSTFGLGSRNSWVGIDHRDFGRVIIGTLYTPAWWSTNWMATAWTSNGSENMLLGSPGFNATGTTQQSGRVNTVSDAVFYRRQGNSITYLSPHLAGVQTRLFYSGNQSESVLDASGRSISPTVAGIGLDYRVAPFIATAAFVQHNDYFGVSQLAGATGSAPSATNASSKDTNFTVSLGYRFPTKTLVGVAYETIKYTNADSTGGRVDSFERPAFNIHVEQPIFGPHTVTAGYSKASAGSCSRVGGAACSTSGLEADSWRLQYFYRWNDNFQLLMAAHSVRNGRSAQYAIGDETGNVRPGQDIRQLSLGLNLRF